MAVTKVEKEWIREVQFAPKHKPGQIKMPDAIPLIAVKDLVPYENNVKIHTHEQVARICSSIDGDGRWTAPVIVDGNNVLIAGHGRRLAALCYGITKVPVVKLEGISEEKANQLRLADNKVAEGAIDTELLESELRTLHDFGIDMLGIFGERELEFLTEDLGEIELGALSGDLSVEVEEKANETRQAIEETDERPVPLAEIFNGKMVTTKEARLLSRFMAHIEAKHMTKGLDALVAHADSFTKLDK
ncbi:conserved hypothetical protein [Vibrio coralliirubri]|uniref:ParB/Srx family N-terminal domain-containing protein n=1 Tax=Vibrio coralliirubri TaxID=1516159 RepID=UPI000635B50F|nr:ParB/Srx family N-terminal domain-containing protein [Vibrio coralliirubri]CDT52867.1 conserved hypothetical protein [Vibrio coralliirubri]